MDYPQFRTWFLEALDAAGLMRALPWPVEAVSLDSMRRTYRIIVRRSVQQPRPFTVDATLSWEWDAALAARSATSEEDLLIGLLGRDGYYLVTEQPWLRMDVTLTASLPMDSPIPMPEADTWRRWAAEVNARLSPLLPIESEDDQHLMGDEYGLRVLSSRSEPTAQLSCDPDTGRLYLTCVELSAWQGIDLPRQWDNSDREPDLPPGAQLADFAERVYHALREWAVCLEHFQA